MLDTPLSIALSFSVFFFLLQIFYCFVFLKTATYRPTIAQKTDFLTKQEPISVIIACRNEAENLKKLLPILLAQNYPLFELVLIDDRSYDDTRLLIFEAHKNDSRIKLVRIDEKPEKPDEPDGKKFALTMGIKAAKYDRLLFTDADCIPTTENWIAEMSAYFTPTVNFVLGVSLYNTEESFLNRFIQFETLMTLMQYISWALVGSPYMGVGRNLAYRKSTFLENNGYYHHLRVVGGDDDLIVNRLAKARETAICIMPESQTHSPAKKTWNSWYIQKKRHLSVGKHYKFLDKVKTSAFTFSILFFWLAMLAQLIVGFIFKVDWFYYLVASFITIRWLFLTILVHTIAKKVTIPISAWAYPFWEFCYVAYQLIVGFIALTSSKIAWK